MNKQEVNEPYLTYEQANIITSTQILWERLSFLIRDLLLAVFRDPEREQSTVNQLYNFLTVDFYNFFSFVYGSQIAQQFINYLTNVITDLWGLFKAMSTNNQEASNSYTADIYKVVDQLSTFLARINPYWSADQWRNFFNQFIRATIDEATALASKDYNKEYQIFGDLEKLALLIGDYMARGVISKSLTPPVNTK